jgi:hypothetical protein
MHINSEVHKIVNAVSKDSNLETIVNWKCHIATVKLDRTQQTNKVSAPFPVSSVTTQLCYNRNDLYKWYCLYKAMLLLYQQGYLVCYDNWRKATASSTGESLTGKLHTTTWHQSWTVQHSLTSVTYSCLIKFIITTDWEMKRITRQSWLDKEVKFKTWNPRQVDLQLPFTWHITAQQNCMWCSSPIDVETQRDYRVQM